MRFPFWTDQRHKRKMQSTGGLSKKNAIEDWSIAFSETAWAYKIVYDTYEIDVQVDVWKVKKEALIYRSINENFVFDILQSVPGHIMILHNTIELTCPWNSSIFLHESSISKPICRTSLYLFLFLQELYLHVSLTRVWIRIGFQF